MPKRITRATLNELEKEMLPLSEQEQQAYLGGGAGTESDPYTLYEFLMLRAGGDQRGCWVLSQGYPVYVFSGQSFDNTLNEVVIVGHQTGYFNPVVPTYLQEDPFANLNQQEGGDSTGYYSTGYYNEVNSDPDFTLSGYSQYVYGGNSWGGGGSTQRPNRIIADARSAISKFIGYDKNDKPGCLRRCLDMLGYRNNRIGAIRNIQMVTKGDNGRAGEHTAEYQEGLNLINTLLAQKRPVVVGIDYSTGRTGETINEGITDHFVVIVSKETRLIDGKETEVYRYYDPITKHADLGTHKDNYLYLKDNKLIGVYKYHPSRPLDYTVTQVREYKKP